MSTAPRHAQQREHDQRNPDAAGGARDRLDDLLADLVAAALVVVDERVHRAEVGLEGRHRRLAVERARLGELVLLDQGDDLLARLRERRRAPAVDSRNRRRSSSAMMPRSYSARASLTASMVLRFSASDRLALRLVLVQHQRPQQAQRAHACSPARAPRDTCPTASARPARGPGRAAARGRRARSRRGRPSPAAASRIR